MATTDEMMADLADADKVLKAISKIDPLSMHSHRGVVLGCIIAALSMTRDFVGNKTDEHSLLVEALRLSSEIVKRIHNEKILSN